ncbi:MAG: SH3 domain-containing protein [Pseudomonadota bacterium]
MTSGRGMQGGRFLALAVALCMGAAGAAAQTGGLTGGLTTGLSSQAPTLPGAGGPGGMAGYGVGPVTKLPMPRYVSLRARKINVRRGPGLNYRIDWVFQRSALPVRIVGEFGDWRQIIDSDGATGWVFHALVTGRRTVLVTEGMVPLRARPEDDGRLRAKASEGVVADLRQCTRDWCEIETDVASGWLPKTAIWGVDQGELWPR